MADTGAKPARYKIIRVPLRASIRVSLWNFRGVCYARRVSPFPLARVTYCAQNVDRFARVKGRSTREPVTRRAVNRAGLARVRP